MISTIYVVSKGKPETASIYSWFKEHGFKNYVTVVSNEDNVKIYQRNYGGGCIKAPKRCDNLSKKREFILNKFSQQGKWIFMVCDNIIKVKSVPQNRLDDPQRVDFNNDISPQELLQLVNKNIKMAEDVGAGLVGFASNGNPYFRKKHFSLVGFVWGKMLAIKNDGMLWDHSQDDMDDYVTSATALLRWGKVFIDKYVYAHSKRFETVGGNGSYDARVKGKIKASAYLVNNYNGMFRYKDRPGYAKNSEIQMRFTSLVQVSKWRMQLGKTTSGYVKT